MSDRIYLTNQETIGNYRDYLKGFLNDTGNQFYDFVRATNDLIWDDEIMKKVIDLTNNITKSLNNIRSATQASIYQLDEMIEQMDKYISLTKR